MQTKRNTTGGHHARLSVTEAGEQYRFFLEGLEPEPVEAFVKKDDSDDAINERLAASQETEDKFLANQAKNYFTEFGKSLFEQYIPSSIASLLQSREIQFLSIHPCDSLAGLPWEMLNDGTGFFCTKFSMGREISVTGERGAPSLSKNDIRFLLIEDPTGTLLSARKEIGYLMGALLRLPGAKVRRGGPELRKAGFLNALGTGNVDVLHFSGHADFNEENPEKSFLVFGDSDCHAYEIVENLKGNPPAVVFSNACSSASINCGEAGLVHAFLSRGVSAYIGSMWPISDRLAGMIGEEFYRYLIYGKTVGDALRLARENSFNKFGWNEIDWLAFTLYGDPSLRIFS